jgi:predicted nucleic acid-binding protein
MPVAFDTNVLVYAEIEPDSLKGETAQAMLLRGAGLGVLPVQVIGEFLRVVQRKRPSQWSAARRQVATYADDFAFVPTDAAILNDAMTIAERYRLKLWDAAICAAALAAGCRALLSEDMGDGQRIDGLMILNPFNPDNARAIDLILPPIEDES